MLVIYLDYSKIIVSLLFVVALILLGISDTMFVCSSLLTKLLHKVTSKLYNAPLCHCAEFCIDISWVKLGYKTSTIKTVE